MAASLENTWAAVPARHGHARFGNDQSRLTDRNPTGVADLRELEARLSDQLGLN